MALPATAEHWLECAQQAKAFAERVSDPTAKRGALMIVRGYEALARHAIRVEELKQNMHVSNGAKSQS
jgi:hypothetical protein